MFGDVDIQHCSEVLVALIQQQTEYKHLYVCT